MKASDTRISVTKALCIILMVIGHSRCPILLSEYIYQFHMPCFFFVSGFLFKEKYLNDTKTFIKHRIKGLWWPFVKWSILFMLFHNIFAELHLYNNSYEIKDMGYKLFRILTMTGSEQLLEGYWFLKQLLYASIISVLSLKLLTHFCTRFDHIYKGSIILLFLFLILSYVLYITPIKIPTIGGQTMLATSFFIAGYVYKISYNQESKLSIGLISLFSVFVATFFFTGSMETSGLSIFPYFTIAIIGSIGVINIAGLIKGKAMTVLNYIGGKTLYILTFHYISFKLVSLFLILCNGISISHLADFPVLQPTIPFSCIIYSIVGVVVPLGLWELSHFLQLKLKYAIHNIRASIITHR